jgi:glycosyltransferase involved in cell wall biosynthesis
MIVHQVLSGAGPVDAVTNQALAYRRAFRQWGWGGYDHASMISPGVGRAIEPLAKLDPGAGDVLLFHYSAYAPRLRPLLALPNRKLLVSHNVTPARYLWGYEPVVAIYCAVGRAQLPEFAHAMDLAAGVSEYNVSELVAAGARRTAVIPIVFERPPVGRRPAGVGDTTRPPAILFVGRITPHKRHDLLLRAFALYRRHRAPNARLTLIGDPVTPSYGEAVRALADELAPGAVTIESGIAAERLWDHYRQADAFVSLSEHEGFCVPLLEAFHFGVPVVARAVGAIPEVAGDAAVLLPEAEEDLAVVAELMHAAVHDQALRAELQARGEERLATYATEVVLARLRDAVTSVATPAMGRASAAR